MATEKRLAEMATVSGAMPATVGLCLWVLFGLLRVDVFFAAPMPPAPIPEPTLAAPVAPIPEPTPVAQADPIRKLDPTGTIVKLDAKGTIVLAHPQNGLADAPTVVDQYRVRDGLPISHLDADDKVDFTAAQVGGVWTVTKIQKQ